MDEELLKSMSSAISAHKGNLASIFDNLFNDSREPYADAQRDYDRYFNQGTGALNPYNQAGQNALGKYQDWLGDMQDPSGFINNLMGKYQESPYAQYSKRQAMRGGINAASAGGLIGSTPFQQGMAEQYNGIGSKDMQDWLSRVLGVNNEYGHGEADIFHTGANSANALANMYGRAASDQGDLAWAKANAGQQRSGGIIGGLFGL